jgi:hypothetical protein
MPSWNPAMSSVYTGRSLLHTWYPERQLFGILNAHTLLQLQSKVRGLASGAPILSHWKIFIGCCSELPILLALCQLMNINKLASWEEQGPSSWGVFFYKAKLKLLKFTWIKSPSVADPDVLSRIQDPDPTIAPSRIRGVKKHRIPDPEPQYWKVLKEKLKNQ